MTVNNKSLELIARRIANRSKKQRSYFDDDDDVSRSRKIEGLWTYGREVYGLKKLFVYVPYRSQIPLKELSELLSRVDDKLERAGNFKRILCVYGGQQFGQGVFLKGHSSIGADHWNATLTMMTDQNEAPSSLLFNTFWVNYEHILGTKQTIRPTLDNPVIIVAPHREIVVTENAEKGMRALRRNISWVFYDDQTGWSMESKGVKYEVS